MSCISVSNEFPFDVILMGGEEESDEWGCGAGEGVGIEFKKTVDPDLELDVLEEKREVGIVSASLIVFFCMREEENFIQYRSTMD